MLNTDRFQSAIRTYNAVMNIVTDLALATVPTLMIVPLQINFDTRVQLLIAFWCRVVYVHIISWNDATSAK